ncbi:MAG: FlaD/FlaE family flagellar protein [Thermoplasmatota archaeon]
MAAPPAVAPPANASAPKPAAAPTPGAPGAATPPRDDVGGRLDKLETALASLKDLRDLSEIISVQYNPFLDHPANAAPVRPGEGTASAPAIAPSPPTASSAPPVVPEPAAPVSLASPSPQPAAQGPHAILPAPAMNTTMESLEDPAPDGQMALHGAPSLYGPHTVFAPSRPVGGPRETFLAIHWYTYLAEGTDPSIIYLYLDYYQNAGWFGAAEFAWLEQLARGLAVRRPGAKWSDYGLDSRRLAQSHLRNLRVLDKLFGATLQHGEAQYLQQTLDALLGEA